MEYEDSYELGKNTLRRICHLDLAEGKSPQWVSAFHAAHVSEELTHAEEMVRRYPENGFWRSCVAFYRGQLSVLD